MASPGSPAQPAPWLAVTAIAYSVLHHVGSGFAWLGPVGSGPSRWADWIDLATPYAFLLSAAVALWCSAVTAPVWLVYLVGALTYVEGHGIHLSANSINNVSPSPAAHLWDEVVGHYLWFTGAMLVWVALATTLAHRRPSKGAVLALAVGVTAATNSLEGGTAVLGLVAAGGLAIWGWRTRGTLLLTGALPALLVISGWGVWHGGFPQPSELGWG